MQLQSYTSGLSCQFWEGLGQFGALHHPHGRAKPKTGGRTSPRAAQTLQTLQHLKCHWSNFREIIPIWYSVDVLDTVKPTYCSPDFEHLSPLMIPNCPLPITYYLLLSKHISFRPTQANMNTNE